jgi:hypothetical protein
MVIEYKPIETPTETSRDSEIVLEKQPSNEVEIPIGENPTDDDVHVQIQAGRKFDEERYCCRLCKRSPHISSIFTTFFVIACAIFVGISLVGLVTAPLSYVSYGLLVFAVLFYIIEVFACSTFRYLINFNTSESIVDYVQRIKSCPPVLRFHCEVS